MRFVLENITIFFDTSTRNLQHHLTISLASPELCNKLGQTGEDYLLFVHGFNVTGEEKVFWPATAYKRLWWQGFKGRLGIFSWPCSLLSPNVRVYDNSDFEAWEAGSDLEWLLLYLQNSRYGGHVHLLAHSQGNVVAGNALRMLPDNRRIKTYIASQAAISKSCYQFVPRAYFEDHPMGGHTTPDVRAEYPGWTDFPRTPFLDSVKAGDKANKFVNLFNPEDYALVSATIGSWKQNNRLRPDIMYDYHGKKDEYDETLPENPSYFYHGATASPDNKLHFPTPTIDHGISDTMDTYAIFSYAAEAWGEPIGSLDMSGIFQDNINLENLLGYDDNHYSHSRQFRSNIIAEKPYWQKIFLDYILNLNTQNH